MSLNRFGSQREPAWWPSEIAARADSALRLRSIQRSTGLEPFVPVDWSEHARVFNQIGNSCTGWSRSQCLWLWLSLAGKSPDNFPDAMRNYYYARTRRGNQQVDSGVFGTDCWWAGAKFGDCALPTNRAAQLVELFTPPRAAEDLQAVDVNVTYKRIVDSGERLVYRICDSLALNQPVQLSIPVEESILEDKGPELIDAPDKPLNMGHAVAVIGCRLTKSRQLPDLLVVNSWGPDWRLGGRAWLTGAYAGQGYGVTYIDGVEGWS